MPNNKAECTRNIKVSEYQEDMPLCSVFENSFNLVESLSAVNVERKILSSQGWVELG